jgi:signal transduction histidine kinase
MIKTMLSKYAGEIHAGRAKHVSMLRDVLYLANDNDLQNLLNAMPVYVAILNHERQIVMANEKFLEVARGFGIREVLELRPGEALKCKNRDLNPDGCGSSDFCTYCGALRGILLSQQHKKKITEECRMTIKINNKEIAADFLTTAAPLRWQNREYTILTFTDIGDEKRRKAIERILFHDLIYNAGNLQRYVELFLRKAGEAPENDFLQIAESITNDLVEELLSYRMLFEAENFELKLNFKPVLSTDIIQTLKKQIEMHEVAKNRVIELSDGSESFTVLTDPALLGRILNNMLKNALEASEVGSIIKMGCNRSSTSFKFWVQNPAVMAEETKKQVFQRSYSTKGLNRGLGTYSMKLLARYLSGKVSFTSESPEGTIFSIVLP